MLKQRKELTSLLADRDVRTLSSHRYTLRVRSICVDVGCQAQISKGEKAMLEQREELTKVVAGTLSRW